MDYKINEKDKTISFPFVFLINKNTRLMILTIGNPLNKSTIRLNMIKLLSKSPEHFYRTLSKKTINTLSDIGILEHKIPSKVDLSVSGTYVSEFDKVVNIEEIENTFTEMELSE